MTALNASACEPVCDVTIDIEPARMAYCDDTFDGLFAAFYCGQQLCVSSQPFVDAAIALLELGAPPGATICATLPCEPYLRLTENWPRPRAATSDAKTSCCRSRGGSFHQIHFQEARDEQPRS